MTLLFFLMTMPSYGKDEDGSCTTDTFSQCCIPTQTYPTPLYSFHQLTSTQSHAYTDNLGQQASPCSLSLCEEGILFGSHTLNRLRKGLDRGKECKITFEGRHHKGFECFFR
jgi:hypothetical protein